MPAMIDLTAWTATLLGFYVLFSGIGAMRTPNAWRKMIEEISESPAMQLVAGLLELFVGSVIYIANPWVPADLLSCVLKGIGGLMIMEALFISGFCDIYTHFWLRTMNHMHRGWALLMIVVGAVLAVLGMLRFG
jgi:uncharacterized protein YjeT (DUF2065 family)